MNQHPLPAVARRLCQVALLPVLVTLVGCISAMRSTEGGRRDARRECLALTRATGWTVNDISDARWLGAGKHEVQLTVEKTGAPSRMVRCVYDSYTRVANLPDESGTSERALRRLATDLA